MTRHEFAAALRATKWPQDFGRLYHEGRACAIGAVALDKGLITTDWLPNTRGKSYLDLGRELLPSGYERVIFWNDYQKLSFSEIASALEAADWLESQT